MRYPDGHDARSWADATASPVSAESMTQQQFGHEQDINTILRRFGVTGQAPLAVGQAVYGDFTGIFDYEDALAKVRQADEDFMRLPPEIRERFGNSPGGLIEYARGHSYEEYLEESAALQKKQLQIQEAAAVGKGLSAEAVAASKPQESTVKGAASLRPETVQ